MTRHSSADKVRSSKSDRSGTTKTSRKEKSHTALSKKETRTQKFVKNAFPLRDEGIKRVIAPYVKTTPKVKMTPVVYKDEYGYFSYYLKRKPSVLMQDLTQSLADVDLPGLLDETSQVIKLATAATEVRLYLVDDGAKEIYFETPLPSRHRINYKIGTTSIVAAYVAHTKQYIMLEDVLCDNRFPDGLGYKHESSMSVLCVPIVTPTMECFAVLELTREANLPHFNKDNLKIVVVMAGWMGAAIHQNQERLSLLKKQELNDYLLDLTRCYFANAVPLDNMISEVVNFAKTTLGAERGTFHIIGKDKNEMSQTVYEEGLDDGVLHKKNIKLNLARDKTIVGVVAKTAQPLNIKDVQKDPRYNAQMDHRSAIIIRSVLCFPIMGLDGILGVIQMINKKNGAAFTPADEVLFQTFSVYCGLTLQYSKVYNEHQESDKMYQVAIRMLDHHMLPCNHDIEFFRESQINMPQDLETFGWYITPELEPYMPHILLHLLTSMNTEEFDMTVTRRFVLQARKAYRSMYYHNFHHAFNVTHCMYNILVRNTNMFSDFEKKVLLISCLCHDMNHFGFTNNFLSLTNDVLAQLHEESTLENHHYYVGMLLLQQNKIFVDMDENTYRRFTSEMKEAILYTDLALYFRCRCKLMQILNEGIFSWQLVEHRSLVKSIMMTTCDLSGNCKSFSVSKMLADALYKEFYYQGDLEKGMGLVPLSMMDRDQQNSIPLDQIKFLEVVVIPCCELLGNIFPNTDDLRSGAVTLRDAWKEIKQFQGERCWRQDQSVAK